MSDAASEDAPAFPVVGIGASAGGLKALEGFFRATSPAPGMALVVVMHLAPDKPSLLPEILARHTAMKVEAARDGQIVEKDKVYVLPPNAILTISEGVLRLQTADAVQHQRSPIDVFFSSLAHDCGEYAVGIILSGSGSDGVLGVKAIKAYCGITIAQAKDSSGPGFASMPDSAIASGLVDFAIPVADMPARLSEIVRGFDQRRGAAMKEPPLADPAVTDERAAICAILRSQTGHDFSGYKIRTFARRVYRRMQIHQCVTLRDYVQLLRENANEATLLFRDLLINVTSFFRDAEAFEVLRQTAIPRLFEGKTPADWVRVWAPGCSTGEEAISIAILLREFLDTLASPPRVTVFATDIDEAALAAARAARYPERLMGGVSPERLKRFFVAQAGAYVVAKAVRDLCVFSPHDVLRDPPFSRMDMVSCRNLLIYFDGDAQRRVFPVFHYALRPGGFLFLGQSETIGRFTDLFTPLNKTKCLYQAVDGARPMSMPLSIPGSSPGPFAMPASDRTHSRSGSQLRSLVEARIALLTPPHVVVTGDGEILYASARTGKYLELPAGVPTRQLVSMAHKDLRLDLRSALRQALQTGETAARENVRFEAENGRVERVSLVVEPLPARERGPPELLIVFRDGGPVSAGTAETVVDSEATADTTPIAAELHDTRLQLQTTVDEYETALEDLRLANEQMMSLNEETQSTNEELESSKEELQSLNEEMQTVNQEILAKVEDLDRANRDLRNVFVNARIATVFLDRNLAIRSFTPPVEKLFSVISTDVGRPLTDLVTDLDYPGLRDDLRKVLVTGVPLELSIRTKKDAPQYYLVRITPSYDSGNAIDGVVGTFIDTPALDKAEGTIQKLYAERLEVVQMMAAGLAHEINQPLAAVTMCLETLRRMFAMPPQDRAGDMETVLERAYQQTMRAARIISDLRAFIAQNEPDKTVFRVHDVIREVSDEFMADPRRDKVRVTLQLAVGDDRVFADRTQIDQVLVNLMQNAYEAMTASSRCDLTIGTQIENGALRVNVSDTGSGIAAAIEGKVFEPFHSTKKRGMGIGLPLSRKIIEAHRGKIWYRPNPGGGTVFSFTLPLAEI